MSLSSLGKITIFGLRPLGSSLRQRTRHFSHSTSKLARAPKDILDLTFLTDDAHHSSARTWLGDFNVGDIPKDAYQVTYSRSSGPGGQHVNTTSSKASVRCDLVLSYGVWLPRFLGPPLSQSPHHHASPATLLISSQTSRSASDNLQRCLSLLHQTIVDAARSIMVGETSEAQKERVRGLQKLEKTKRREGKDRRSMKKADRRGDRD